MEEKVFIKNSKGLKLACVVHCPYENGRYPAIILLHGFTGYKEEPHIEKLAETLAENGFVAVRFDASGSGESDGTFEKDYLMSNYLEDIGSVYNYLKSQEFVDRERIGIAGHSLGGLLSIVFVSSHPEMKACIPISAPTSLFSANWTRAALERWREVGWFYKEFSKNGSKIKIPYAFFRDSKKYNALDFAEKLHCPLMVVVGSSDKVVKPSDTKQIFDNANQPKELVEVEKAGHDYKRHLELVNVINAKILDFLKKYL